jgi:hypothetical protein
MNRLSKCTVIAIACFSLLLAGDLFALLTLNIDTNAVSIPFLTTDYNSSTGAAQVIKTSAETLTIRSTTNTWTLTVRALTATFSFVPSLGDPNPNKPAGDLAVRAPATSLTWLVLTTANQVLSTGPKAAGNQTRALDYRLNSNLNANPPGTYTISVIYTLTSP